ncbi:hypothetical protein HMPREF0063_11099 [Aeromicrobium marinum DSM 15272]|uniref:Uncharacterized protein n=1 Tax=Aeromicrobium marinum DSM 15272 TaxID=585531 RepID=E2SAP1_9ACTN|nr:hypothetical protein [Aeromicrobium marinum]EFQ83437.1 hypothetical protein HMPREF0063_11099 [Aeromicrobium marinum DSM 15272]
MGLFDSLFGRSTPPQADIGVLFQVPQAAISLETQGFGFAGLGAVCYRDAEGYADDAAVDEARELVGLDPAATVERTVDRFGFHWVTVRRSADVGGIVTDLHAVNTTLVEAGFGASLLCSTVVFTTPALERLALVYLFKQGTFYPFAPLAGQRRDNALELQVRGLVESDVPVEPDLGRWMALWGSPGLD